MENHFYKIHDNLKFYIFIILILIIVQPVFSEENETISPDNSPELHAEYIEQISDMLDMKLYRDSKKNLEIQNLAGFLELDERSLLYEKYKLRNAGLYSVVNFALIGFGSWFQGDITHGVIITSSYILVGALFGFGSATSMMSGFEPSPQMNILLIAVVSYSVIRPFIYEAENNKKLKKSLLYH